VADERAVDVVGVVCPYALEVASRAPSVAAVAVDQFAVPSADRERPAKVEGIDNAVQREVPLLPAAERQGLAVQHHIEVGHHAEQTLLLLLLQLLLRLFALSLLRLGARRGRRRRRGGRGRGNSRCSRGTGGWRGLLRRRGRRGCSRSAVLRLGGIRQRERSRL